MADRPPVLGRGLTGGKRKDAGNRRPMRCFRECGTAGAVVRDQAVRGMLPSCVLHLGVRSVTPFLEDASNERRAATRWTAGQGFNDPSHSDRWSDFH